MGRIQSRTFRFVTLGKFGKMILRQAIPAFLAMLLWLIIVAVFRAFFPVVIFMEPGVWKANHVTVQAKVTGYKIRDCEVVPKTFIGWVQRGNSWTEVPLTFPDDPSPDSTAPKSYERQSFGIWRWRVDPKTANTIKVTLQHKCDGKVRTTTVGPFHYVPVK